ncbi:hypothetical protein [Sphaerotilus sp.]|uniref:hypothetical protein n=1 Tax=Sphaerotilus sp. TaxID=2093942 RepID=UPI00286E4605|nr:hypothetical protein [Sphaerotilus sp.]
MKEVIDTTVADALNQDCHCLTLDPAALARALDAELGAPGLSADVQARCPYVFAAQPVFVAASHLRRMAEVVHAVESVVAQPAWHERVLAAAPETARVALAPGQALPRSVFFGHDFHLDRDQLGLIEVNTNAGGALLNAVLARAQRACCPETAPLVPTRAHAEAFETAIVAMFRAEWAHTGRTAPLRTIAIVDEAPEAQYLHAEFLLFQQLFARHGLHAVIADPTALDWRAGRLWHGDTAIDLVYNRLTDFYFDQPASAALRQAWMTQTAVITPHPQAHALYADKRHLAVFSDEAALVELGVPAETRALLLAHVPRTEVVLRANAERLWAARRGLFFKPAGGFGSRAAWRGDKLTRRVWDEITARDGDYVAQAIAAPGQRQLRAEDAQNLMKFDLRAYAYDTQVQWVAARLYQGQTTNFRTSGGGFAPVYSTG